MHTQPPFTRGYIAQSADKRPIAVYYIQHKLAISELAVRSIMRRNTVRALRSKGGTAYTAALKYISQLALPQVEGTLRPARNSSPHYIGRHLAAVLA